MLQMHEVVQKYMPLRAESALKYFKDANPEYKEIEWAGVLDILINNGAHGDMIEAIYEDLRIIVPIGTEDFIAPVFLTLLYSNKGRAPFAGEVTYWHGFVMGCMERNT